MPEPPVLPDVRDRARRSRFEAVYNAHFGAVWAYLRRRVAIAADADDVAAQTWIAIWRRVDDLPVDRELAWCYGTARRCLANHRRGEQRRLRLAHTVARERVDDAVRATDPHPEDPRAARLRAALATLRPADQELLRLFAWEQLTTAEIAVVLDLGTNAVAIRAHRARRRLAAALGEPAAGAAKDLDRPGHSTGTAPEGAR